MRKIILTSTGLDNKNIEKIFLKFVSNTIETVKVLFIPTAAITKEQKVIVPMCKKDLLNAGVLDENIVEYNLDRELNNYEIRIYDAIYICGGDTKYLLDRANAVKFKNLLNIFFDNNGVCVGVSAGSIIFANNYDKNLNYLDYRLNVHCEQGTTNELIDNVSEINLTDNQAIIIEDSKIYLVE